jgi:hypothetical protein
MQCPQCHYEPLPAGAQECPNCHTPLGATRQVQVNLQAQDNQGVMIGVQAQNLNGSVYGSNIIYLLNEAGRGAGAGAFFKKGSLPYKALAPYTPLDSLIFKGRERETAQLIGRINEQAVLTVHGAAGVGKTSLLSAGVIPQLAEAKIATVLIRDYSRPLADTLRDGLAACAKEVPIALPAEGGLAEIVKALRDGLQGTLVLILDQAEVLVGGKSAAGSAEQVGAQLAGALDAAGWQYLRVIFAVEEGALARLDGLRGALPDVLRNSLPLFQLEPQQARAAIIEPLGRLDSPFHFEIGFNSELVDSLLLADLDELSQDTPGLIYPPHLQIVCDRLYRAARENNQREIDRLLYLERLHGADGILAGYLEEQLALLPRVQQSPARSVLVWLAGSPAGGWHAGDEVAQAGVAAEGRDGVMAGLVAHGLLVERPVNSHHEYALTSDALAGEIRLRLGGIQAGGYEPEAELERLWSAWLASGDLPGEVQLRRLESGRGRCRHTAAQALLMLRAAAEHNLELAPWLDWLRDSPDGAALVQRLEGLAVGEGERRNYATHLEKAEGILRLKEAAEPPGGWQGKAFGQLAWAAVRSPDAAIRQTAGVALLLLADGGGLNRIEEAAVQAKAGAGQQAELRGAMAEADPAMEAKNKRLALPERVRIHLWRSGRRMRVDQQRLTWLCLGGGLGAGLGLGLLRALTAALTHKTVGIHAFMNFGFGFLLGAALIFGMLLGEYLLLRKNAYGARASNQATLLSLVLGGVMFGAAAVVVALSSGSLALAGKGMVITAGFEIGLSLALALYPFPYLGQRDDFAVRTWWWRILGAGSFFALSHAGFIQMGINDLSAVIIWPGAVYKAELVRYELLPMWAQLQALPGWFNGVALADAFLTGAVLCAGILISIRLVARIIHRWRSLITG